MARPFNKRRTYDREAQKLLEFSRLIEGDSTRPELWRTSTAEKIRSLVKDLLDAPPPQKA